MSADIVADACSFAGPSPVVVAAGRLQLANISNAPAPIASHRRELGPMRLLWYRVGVNKVVCQNLPKLDRGFTAKAVKPRQKTDRSRTGINDD
jgi:hypothetical protein